MTTLDPTTRSLIHEATTWRLLGRLFERPRPGWLDDLQKLAAEIDDEELRVAAREAAGQTEGEYLRRIGPGGAASPREAGHRGMNDPGWILSDLQRYYHAFAFHPAAEDPPDHIAVETAFVAFLYLKEAYARAGNDPDGEKAARSARESFLQEHLSSLAAPLAQLLLPLGPNALLSAAVALTVRTPAPLQFPYRPPDEPFACSGCG